MYPHAIDIVNKVSVVPNCYTRLKYCLTNDHFAVDPALPWRSAAGLSQPIIPRPQIPPPRNKYLTTTAIAPRHQTLHSTYCSDLQQARATKAPGKVRCRRKKRVELKS